METARFVGFAPSVAWLIAHPEAAAAARQSATAPGEVFADAVLADPTRLVGVHRALVLASLEPGTPAGVTSELIQVLGRLARLAATPTGTRRALLPVVGSLKGLRDRDEMLPALRARADSITDLPTRERLLELARYVSTELTVTKRGPFGQVVVEPVTPTEPTPVTPDGPLRPKPEPGKGSAEPVVPLVVEGSAPADLLDQVAAAGSEAASEWADKAGFPPEEAGESGAVHATKLAIEIAYGGDVGEGVAGAGRCLLAEVLSRVGEQFGGLHGHAMGWEFGMAACDSPTPHGVQTAIVSWATALQGHTLTEVDLSPMLANLFCGGFPSCLIADQMLKR